MKNNQCICQSGKPFSKCCYRFLNKGLLAKTPEQLMRSRFSAFALGGYGEYLFATWSPSQLGGLTSAELSLKTVEWLRLEIVSKSQKGDVGYVEFKASFLDANGETSVHHELSEFERVKGRWLYLSGEIY